MFDTQKMADRVKYLIGPGETISTAAATIRSKNTFSRKVSSYNRVTCEVLLRFHSATHFLVVSFAQYS